MYYKAGLELKGNDKYGAYVKPIGNLRENIQLVDPLAIMHAVNKSRGAKPLGSKFEMSTNITVFLAYAPVGHNAKAFQPKKIGQRAGRAKMSLTPLILMYIRRWYSCWTLNQKPSSLAWNMNLAMQGGFIFGRSNSSAKKR